VFSFGHVDQDASSVSQEPMENTFISSFREIYGSYPMYQSFASAPNKNNNHTNISCEENIGLNYVPMDFTINLPTLLLQQKYK